LSRALNQKHPIIAKEKRKVILLLDNARSHVTKVIKNVISTSMESFITRIHCAPSDYYLFRCNTALLTSTSKYIKK